jgi:hypothetical protein
MQQLERDRERERERARERESEEKDEVSEQGQTRDTLTQIHTHNSCLPLSWTEMS